MNSQIGKIKDHNNKILVSSSNFKIGTDLKINLDDHKHIENDKPDVKSRKEEIIKTKSNIKSKKDNEQHIKMIKTEPDITDEEEKAALVLGITSIFTV